MAEKIGLTGPPITIAGKVAGVLCRCACCGGWCMGGPGVAVGIANVVTGSAGIMWRHHQPYILF